MTLEVTGSNPVIYLSMLNTLELIEHLDWAQKRFNIVKEFQKFEHCKYKLILGFFSKKKKCKKKLIFLQTIWILHRLHKIHKVI